MSRQLRVADKVIIVTGASSGLGRDIALKLAEEGARLVVCAARKEKHDVDEEATHSLICARHGVGRAIFQKTDVTIPDDVAACVQEAIAVGGRLDVLVNNAGYLAKPLQRTHEVPLEVWDRTFNIMSRGPFIASQHAITQFLKQEQNAQGVRGHIINIGSFFSHIGSIASPSYCSSKGALLQLTKAIAKDYAADGIQSNIVCPGYSITEMTEDVLADEEIRSNAERMTPWWSAPDGSCAQGTANMVAFLASNESKFITGASMSVDGGVLA